MKNVNYPFHPPLVVTCDPGVVSPLQAAVLEASLACDNLPCDALGR